MASVNSVVCVFVYINNYTNSHIIHTMWNMLHMMLYVYVILYIYIYVTVKIWSSKSAFQQNMVKWREIILLKGPSKSSWGHKSTCLLMDGSLLITQDKCTHNTHNDENDNDKLMKYVKFYAKHIIQCTWERV